MSPLPRADTERRVFSEIAPLKPKKPDPESLRELECIGALSAEIAKAVVGQREVIERLLVGLLCNGHILLEGVPGLGKTLAVKTLARSLDVRFQRIQFTPDLLPADIAGTMIFDPKSGTFFTRRGPLFANIILADEVNRAPAKTQSALLEAMEERQVTIGDETHRLEEPFLVLATQNPIEHEGTYPLPEAQVDRFMLKVKIGYPKREEELTIMRQNVNGHQDTLRAVASARDILAAREAVRSVYLDEKIERYVLDIVVASRHPQQFRLEKLLPWIRCGASPRASIHLALAAKARALVKGRSHVLPEDVRALAPDVLRHRLSLTYEAEAEDISSDRVIEDILSRVPVP